jgi:ATP-dependent DNA helicase
VCRTHHPALWASHIILLLLRQIQGADRQPRKDRNGPDDRGDGRAAFPIELEGEHIEVMQSNAAGKRSMISDAELDMLLDRRKEFFEGRGVGWKSGAATAKGRANMGGANGGMETPRRRRADADGGLFDVYEAPVDEGNDVLAHMLGEDASASM